MELEVLKQDKTDVGSYFVSNYPPFSAWSAAHLPEVERRLQEPASNPPPLGLYLHIPFCRKRCKFCYFRVYTDKNANDVERYLDALTREVALYADLPRLRGRQFEFVYFGGGTPSFLSEKQLNGLIERINRHWRWDAAREVTFECEPGTLKKPKLQAIRDIGVTRLSLGVEHFDDDILELNGRAHRSAEIYRAYDWVREVGFPQVNIDLIAGLVGETEERWQATVERALAFQPDSLTIYQLELPHNAVFSREAKSGQSPTVATWPQKRAWVNYAFERFLAGGYEVSSGYTLVKPSERSSFVYRDALWHGADMVGTGVASFSHVGGVHYQNLDRWEEYLAAIDAGTLPLARALPLTDRQALIRELILQLKLGRIESTYFAEKFGTDVHGTFREAWDALAAEGYARMENGTIHLTRDGLLRVDGLLPRFFESQFQNVRYT